MVGLIIMHSIPANFKVKRAKTSQIEYYFVENFKGENVHL